MLTGGICKAYTSGVEKFAANGKVETLAKGLEGAATQGRAALFQTTAEAFLADAELQEELFGSASLIVRCDDEAQLLAVLNALEGQLTVAVHMDEGDHDAAGRLRPTLELLAGRLLVNGFGTGVEVSPAMVHGGPYPSTSDGRSTSVGTLAIYRFLRPVCYQDFPASILPEALKDR
jgi:NADP-dependent aldehyde dehydrogenase